MYTKRVLDIFQDPQNAGGMKGANGVGKVGGTSCSDVMKIYLLIEDGVVQDATFKTFGSCAAIASTDVACELVKGRTLQEAANLTGTEILHELGELPQNKIYTTVLAEQAVKAALDDYYKRQEKLQKKAD